jgi:phage tail sheath gpL-like
MRLLKTYWLPLLFLTLAVGFVGLSHAGLIPTNLAGLLTPAAAMGMAISFNAVPSNLRIPFATAEFDSSRASQGPALLPYRVLIIGQKLAAGSAGANTLQRVTNPDQVMALAGRGSMLHRMAMKFFANNKFTETWLGVLSDNGAGVAAVGTMTVTGPATAAGTLNLYLGGVLIQVAIAVGDAQNTIATAIGAAINANLDLPVTASVATNVVTVTFRHKGEAGNAYDMRLNYQDGEATPAGVAIAFVQLTGGTSNPALATLIAAMGDTWFHVIAHPYTDATSLTAIEAELSSRFGPMRMIDGVAITSASGTQGALSTIGDSRNSQHSAIVSQPGKNPLTPAMEFAAAVAGVVSFFANIDPARPLQTLPIQGVLPPAAADRFTNTERNLMLFDGIGTSKAVAGGVVQVERVVTTYQTNAAGASDTAYLDVTTMLTLLYLRFSWRNLVLTKYPRHKLANDGTRVGAGQAIVTPKTMKAEAVGWFRQMEALGLVEGFDQFKNDLVVERNATDPNRLDVLLPPDVINQLVVTAAKIQFLV